ncbi:MAG: Asp-tRNA(Asn)/Glu-tRNA(Gln) amidotransferase subunit GatA [Candidatus Accumulibacter sp.]|jgi:aspartyl-tRNA(Asn)/glutamyl-tRNA(Gln) amidotransferase subunit A|nr:Asp-tRNA(Asn)/Glu-tRNA(Gln) amidotransferase subunit GatA [Accumulibacter sp.]
MIARTLREFSRALEKREISSIELTRFYLDRIERYNPKLNAFITLDPERSLAQAKEADARIAAGRAEALTGVPLAQKDIFCARGWRTSCASRMLADFVSPYDSTVVERFNAEGVVLLGKTNMDEFAMGSSNENSYFGPVRNPWDTDRVPGGSSGGSAAAVAASLAPAATATDTGGSIRQPSALSGVTGIKPTYGIVSRYGMIAFASSLDQGGPIAWTAEDCALLLNAMSGFDERDSTSLDRPKEDYLRELSSEKGGKPLAGLKIGLPKEFFGEGCERGVMDRAMEALAVYRELGARTVEISLPNMELSIPAYYVIAPAEASSNLSRYDGVRYGYRAPEYGDIDDMYGKTRSQGFGAEVRRRILIGTYVLSHGYYDAYYLQAQRVRRLIANDFSAAFECCDIIAGPTTPTTAFRIGEKTADPVRMYLSDIYTIAVNLAGLPGLSHPCGFSEGLPVGFQLIGGYFSEARLLEAAHRFQQATDWHLCRPTAFDGV